MNCFNIIPSSILHQINDGEKLEFSIRFGKCCAKNRHEDVLLFVMNVEEILHTKFLLEMNQLRLYFEWSRIIKSIVLKSTLFDIFYTRKQSKFTEFEIQVIWKETVTFGEKTGGHEFAGLATSLTQW